MFIHYMLGSIAWDYLQCMRVALLTFSRRLQPVALSKAVRSYPAPSKSRDDH